MYERGADRVGVCVGASLIQESNPAEAAVVRWSVFSLRMLTLPLSAVGRSLTVGIYSCKHNNVWSVFMLFFLLVGDSFAQSDVKWCLLGMLVFLHSSNCFFPRML